MPHPAPAEAHPTAEGLTETRWYGWQTLAIDGAAIGLLALAMSEDTRWDGNLLAWGTALYALGGPSVHLAHRRGSESLASVSLRLLVPLPGAFIGAGFRGCASEKCGWRAIGAGLLAGAGAAAVLDAALLAYDDAPAPPVRKHRSRRERKDLFAGFEIGPERRALVLSGNF